MAKKRQNLTPKKLKILITIVNRNKAEFYLDLLQSFEVNMQMVLLGNGTANIEMIHLLGLVETKKAVIFTLIREDNVKKALSVLSEKFKTIKNGKGIAYTIPISSIVGVAIYQFLANNRVKKEEKK